MATEESKSFVQVKSINKTHSTFEQTIIKFNEAIFGISFVLLKEDYEPIWLFGCLMVFQTMQLLAFPFHNIVCNLC